MLPGNCARCIICPCQILVYVVAMLPRLFCEVLQLCLNYVGYVSVHVVVMLSVLDIEYCFILTWVYLLRPELRFRCTQVLKTYTPTQPSHMLHCSTCSHLNAIFHFSDAVTVSDQGVGLPCGFRQICKPEL